MVYQRRSGAFSAIVCIVLGGIVSFGVAGCELLSNPLVHQVSDDVVEVVVGRATDGKHFQMMGLRPRLDLDGVLGVLDAYYTNYNALEMGGHPDVVVRYASRVASAQSDHFRQVLEAMGKHYGFKIIYLPPSASAVNRANRDLQAAYERYEKTRP